MNLEDYNKLKENLGITKYDSNLDNAVFQFKRIHISLIKKIMKNRSEIKPQQDPEQK
jgi:hypothetical protein